MNTIAQVVSFAQVVGMRLWVNVKDGCGAGHLGQWVGGVAVAPTELGKFLEEVHTTLMDTSCTIADCDAPLGIVAFSVGIENKPQWGRVTAAYAAANEDGLQRYDKYSSGEVVPQGMAFSFEFQNQLLRVPRSSWTGLTHSSGACPPDERQLAEITSADPARCGRVKEGRLIKGDEVLIALKGDGRNDTSYYEVIAFGPAEIISRAPGDAGKFSVASIRVWR